eukprot:13994254-Heterocapsa_arctica.AAC.1
MGCNLPTSIATGGERPPRFSRHCSDKARGSQRPLRTKQRVDPGVNAISRNDTIANIIQSRLNVPPIDVNLGGRKRSRGSTATTLLRINK